MNQIDIMRAQFYYFGMAMVLLDVYGPFDFFSDSFFRDVCFVCIREQGIICKLIPTMGGY